MKEKIELSQSAELRALRRKTRRIEESRALIKTKSRKKGKLIKAHQDRQTELEKNRDDWKTKCMEKEKERLEANDKYKNAAALLGMKESELQDILKELEELKKKHPLNHRLKKRL